MSEKAMGLRDRRLLRLYLRGREVGCPKCGYALGDFEYGRCPECGLRLRLTLDCPLAAGLTLGTAGLVAWMAVYVIAAVGVLGLAVTGHATGYSLLVLPMALGMVVATDQWWSHRRELSRVEDNRRLALVVACWVGPMGVLMVLFGPAVWG